jgi:threonine aldolase
MSANFRSDNETPIAPAMLEAIVKANQGTAYAYAEDSWSEKLNEAFSTLFRTDTMVIPVSTGTAANSIALAAVTPPWGSVFCHSGAHILNDECGAPEFFGNGFRLVGIEGEFAKLTPSALKKAFLQREGHGVHSNIASCVSITQATEGGSIYSIDEVAAMSRTAHDLGMMIHMDGARFGNAVASLGCHPAEITSDLGIDMLSFGASKNGCMAAEALLFFNQPEPLKSELREKAERIRKRSGHLLSKMRYVSAQLLAYIEDDRWLNMARHANAQAAKFEDAVVNHEAAKLEFPVQGNEVFVRWSAEGFREMENKGIDFLMWPGGDDLARFVFGHSTTDADVEELNAALGR